ncbi:polysaccharide deacetylase family protein [Haloarcula nitratireducens]|uniref:Polysaccharide deacetylase family protein n=1 Tax=Haloarcula nitratireducens TaxID=2487749 RepID=A0AAW4PD46_9EURY|nr:polysaccharide deacetylase family protein [Halomicroarcula nitratireducens]MBX0295733.1 polysaccharide deacetylase family protein [Halomicroarcula nitratireducens]
MKRNSNRRAFLTTTAAGAAAFAGCGAFGDSGQSDTQTPESDGTATSTPAQAENGTGTPEETGTPSQQRDYTNRGKVLDDFEDLEYWGTIQGDVSAETEDVFRGSQSVRIQNPSGGGAGMYKAYPDGLDLTKNNLSIAVKMEKPSPGKLAMEVIAPARSDHLVCRRYIPDAMDGWMRVDLGYTGLRGDPMLKSVQELRIVVLSDGEPINFVVDDLRKHKKPTDKGRVMLSFSDTYASQYDVAFQELKKRGIPAMVAAVPDRINSSGALTTGQLREMQNADWDVVSSPHIGTPLPKLSKDEQRRTIKQTKEYLRLKGFREGMRFMSIPYGSYNRTTLDLVDEFHEYGFAYGAGPNAIPPVGTSAVSTVSGSDLNGAARMINLAAKYNQLTVVNFGNIGKDQSVDKEHLNHLLDIIEDWQSQDKLEVTTPSGLLKLQQS